MSLSPRARQQQLTLEKMGAEVLVYDERTYRAFCLNQVSAAIWTRCDGVRTLEQIAHEVTLELQAPVDEELVRFTLQDLRKRSLLEQESAPESTLPSISRRAMMQRLGASSILLMPLIMGAKTSDPDVNISIIL